MLHKTVAYNLKTQNTINVVLLLKSKRQIMLDCTREYLLREQANSSDHNFHYHMNHNINATNQMTNLNGFLETIK